MLIKKAQEAKRSSGKKTHRYKMPEPGEMGMDTDSIYLYVRKPYRWWWTIVHPDRKKLLLAFMLTMINMLMVPIVATVTGWFVDDVYTDGDLSKVLPYCLIIITVPLIRSLLGLTYRYLFERSSQHLLMRLRAGMYRHLQNMDSPFYDKTSIGDLMARMTGDLDMVRHFTSNVILTALEQLVIFIAGTAVIFSINWKLALAALAFTPPIAFIANRFGREVKPIWSSIRIQFSRLNTTVSQNISGNRVVKAFNRAEYEISKFEEENEAYRKINQKTAAVWIKYIPALDGLANFLIIPVILIGGILVINGEMTLGGLVTFNGLLFVISNPMRMVGGLINEIQRFSASAEKIIELLLERPRVKSDSSQQTLANPNADAVCFRNVSFKYPTHLQYSNIKNKDPKESQADTESERDYALRNITLSVKKGQKIGIVGATGSGKTTLIHLIPRFYDTTEGEVLVNGINVKDQPLRALRKGIGMVTQDVFLFSDTIEGNIAYGDPQAPFADVEQSARIARADDFIERMTENYDTIVGERGVGLSGGQRQRIALARALLINPEILILDDTTSAIDMETEFEIQKGLDQYFAEKTVFIVAHRISSVRKADRILVLDHGVIAEEGTHEELLAKKGIYHNVYLIQTGLSAEEDEGGGQ
jgi:ATP-binding cassette, subfamily B, multidrug efflux pump